MSSNEFTDFLRKAMTASREHSATGSLAYYFMDWRHMTEILSAGQEVYTELLNLCVWAKSNGGMGSFYRSAHELVFLFKNGTGSHRNNIQLGKFGRYRTNVWNYPGANTFSRSDFEGNLLALHPTPKPVALIVDAIKDSTARGDLVLDPFLGSGTTVIAAERSFVDGKGSLADRSHPASKCRRESIETTFERGLEYVGRSCSGASLTWQQWQEKRWWVIRLFMRSRSSSMASPLARLFSRSRYMFRRIKSRR
jgi:hypothetical protein